MKPGDRIMTDRGAAELVGYETHERWRYGRLERLVWFRVRYDDGRERLLPPPPDSTTPIESPDGL